jgi:hypothetical protein
MHLQLVSPCLLLWFSTRRSASTDCKCSLDQFPVVSIIRFVDTPPFCPVFLHGCSVRNACSIYVSCGPKTVTSPLELVPRSGLGWPHRFPTRGVNRQPCITHRGCPPTGSPQGSISNTLACLRPVVFPAQQSESKTWDKNPGGRQPCFPTMNTQ